jgi:Tfp pilus assembly protein PilX
MMISKHDERGYILITILLLLLVLTVIGMAAISTSTIENVLSGNIRLHERNISKADSGAEVSSALIERAVREQDTLGFANIINPVFLTTDVNYLPTELRTSAFNTDTQDTAFVIDTQNVTVDIDKMYTKWIGGTAIEFASGYEGTGKSGGSGFYTFFRINATGAGLVSSVAQIGEIYRYVPK